MNSNEDYKLADAGSLAQKLPENKLIKANIKKLILGIFLLLLVVGIIIVAIVFISKEKSSDDDKSNKKLIVKGEINCEYNIETTLSETGILSKDFIKLSNFDIEIDGEIIKYSKSFKFSNVGLQKVKFLLYEDINMDKMFKDVSLLTSLNMTSDNNVKITSMSSTFENTEQLTNLKIHGFDPTEIKSMNKLFYKSALTSFNMDYLNT